MTMLRPFSRRLAEQRGFTLTEIAIVLGILGIVLGFIWVAGGTLNRTRQINKAVQDVSTIAENVRATFSGNTISLTGDQTANMAALGIIPADLLTGSAANPALNQWNGAIRIFPNPYGTNNRLFRVSYYNTPIDVCVLMATQLAHASTADSPVNFITNTGNTLVPIPNVPGGPTGLSQATINDACTKNIGNCAPSQIGGCSSTEFDYVIH